MSARRGLVLAAAVALIGYAAYGAAMVALHPRYLYRFVPDPFQGRGYEVVEVAVDGAAPLPVQVSAGRPGAPVIVYFMGNVGALEPFRPMLDHHQAAGRTVVAMPYRGGGGVPGAPSERILKRDALAVMDALAGIVPDGPVVVQGYSLGTGLAVHAAARREVAGVILSAPYFRLCELMTRAAYLPACLMPGVQRWDSAAAAAGLTAPVLILHGDRDTLIAPQQGRRLAERLRDSAVAVDFRLIAGAGHDTLFDTPPYLEAIDAFLGEL